MKSKQPVRIFQTGCFIFQTDALPRVRLGPNALLLRPPRVARGGDLEQLPGGERVDDAVDLVGERAGALRLQVALAERAQLLAEEQARQGHLGLAEELDEANREAGAA